MSEVDDLLGSVRKEIQDCEEYLRRAQDIVEVVPIVQERKHEAEAKYLTLTQMPIDILSDSAPDLLLIQRRDEAKLEASLPELPQISMAQVRYLSASGTTSPWYEAVIARAPYTGGPIPWMEPVQRAFDALAQEKAQKARLPAELERVRADLGRLFTVAIDSTEKCQSGILGVDQAVMRMRDVVEQLWGGLVEHARCKCPKAIGGKRLELKREANRKTVAACLSAPNDNGSFLMILNRLWKLHHDELSHLSKNPLSQDVGKIKHLSARWLLLIDDLVKLMNLR